MMTDKNDTKDISRAEKIRKIAKFYGYDSQSRQCIEEMSELTQAINKYWRNVLKRGKYPYNPWDGYMPDDCIEYENMVKEIADVQIMLDQMKFLLSASDEVNRVMEKKIKRQLLRIEEENGK